MMAPMLEDLLEDRLKDVIQTLFEIQSNIHGYQGPATQQSLVRNIHQLTHSLATLSTTSNALPTSLPPEIIEYIDDGRNPDIYTREMVEVVQRSNVLLKGKSEAFAGFRDVLAEEIIKGMPGCEEKVQQALETKGVTAAVAEEEVKEELKMNGNTAGS